MNKSNQLRNDMNQVVLFFQQIGTDFKIGHKTIDTFLKILQEVPDFRDPVKITYKLENILFICFYLALKGEFTSFHHASLYVRIKQDWFVEHGLIRKDEIPSHDTFMRVFQYLDANALRDVFLDKIKYFMERLVELDQDAKNKKTLLSGDGKEFRGSGREDKFRNINVFNVYNASSCLCLSSTPLKDKDSEIKEFQRLIPKFNLKECMVTGDALHCQRNTCSMILKQSGEYTIKVKDNQKELKNEIKQTFEKHSRITTVLHNQCEYSIYILPKNYIGTDWPGAKAYVKMVSHKRVKQKDYNPECQYFISSVTNKELIMETIDNRWCIEDHLHKFKDEFLKEDECTFTHSNAIKTMATINNIVYALYRLAAAANNETLGEAKIRYRDDPIELLSLLLPILDKKNARQLIKQYMRGS